MQSQNATVDALLHADKDAFIAVWLVQAGAGSSRSETAMAAGFDAHCAKPFNLGS